MEGMITNKPMAGSRFELGLLKELLKDFKVRMLT